MGHRYIMFLFKPRKIKIAWINLHIDTTMTNKQLKMINHKYREMNRHDEKIEL